MGLASFLLGYLCGGIMFAYVICKAFRDVNPQIHATKNVGANNVRVIMGGGIKWLLGVIVLDALKATIPLLAFGYICETIGRPLSLDTVVVRSNICWVLVGVGALFGHAYPFALGFKGGKSQSTAIGVLFGRYPHFTLGLIFPVLLLALGIAIIKAGDKFQLKLIRKIPKALTLGTLAFIVLFGPSLSFIVYNYASFTGPAVQLGNVTFNNTNLTLYRNTSNNSAYFVSSQKELFYAGLPFSLGLLTMCLVLIFLFRKNIFKVKRIKTE